jgi:adenine C2-methylase RlmN of 23S rRNA A2503 and tRNA A37
MDRELYVLRNDLDNQNNKIGDMVDKLKKLEKNLSYNNYDDYSNYYSKYKKAASSFEKDRKAFNAKVATRNQLNARYNSLIKSFYR